MEETLRPRTKYAGSIFTSHPNETSVSGEIYFLERNAERPWQSIKYVFDDRTATWFLIKDDYTHAKVDDAELRAKLDAARQEDQETVEEWRTYARNHSGGDTALEFVLFRSINYQNGDVPTSEEKDGVEFWPVGQNASHNFYAGVKDGKRYVRATCWDPEEDHVHSLPDGQDWGYLGHF